MSTDMVEVAKKYVKTLVDLPPQDWTPVTIMTAQTFLRLAYLGEKS